jgi:hypothetical protein
VWRGMAISVDKDTVTLSGLRAHLQEVLKPR